MAFVTLKGGIPPITLVPGMKLKLEAIHPTTGADVANVTATRWAVYGELGGDLGGGGDLGDSDVSWVWGGGEAGVL